MKKKSKKEINFKHNKILRKNLELEKSGGRVINFSRIEKKWQNKWAKSKIFEVDEDSKKKKYYVLEMFPYPSGDGLHMGHAWNYSIGDVYARFKIMQGFNVLHPMGFDSFGLPAENAAIKAKSHPKKFTENAIRNYIKQMKNLGLSYDWSREVETHKPDYYKWDQWIFLKMFEKGLVYRKKSPVNYCKKCDTVLANEQVINGKCWRHEDTKVEVKQLEQWFFKTTAYADELYTGLDKMSGWPELIKNLQRNWIGKSEGVEIMFEIDGEKWPVFTTRADTLFGVTFLVVSAQHSRLNDLVTEKQRKEVDNLLKKIKSTKEQDIDKLEKEGAFTGGYARHPLTNELIPVYVGNFVLADYGSGMVMAVPAHDQRDFLFAKKYKIPVKVVVQDREKKIDVKNVKEAFEDFGILINSQGFDGLTSDEAIEHIAIALQEKKLGKKTVNFRLKDWLISRQRFWGTPIPVVYCDKCGIVPLKEKDLPVKLPEGIKFSGVKNPLNNYKKFLNVKCPKCGGKGRRETDTMDTFVNSSWYYLKYCDAKNKNKIFETKKANYWCPIDIYIGGIEHACLHLIYIRFYTKFLRDIGLLSFSEPSVNLFNQGILLGKDGEKMSKSKGNVVLPEVISEKYGIDAARLFLISVASPDKNIQWSDNGIEGSFRFVKKIFDFQSRVQFGKSSEKIESKLNKTVKQVSYDIENFHYNLCLIKLRGLFESFEKENEISKLNFESFLKMLSLFAPHISEELWEKIGNKNFVSVAEWPKYDEKKINEKFEEQDKNVDKTISDVINLINLLKEKQKRQVNKVYIYVLPQEKEFYNEVEIASRVGKDVRVYMVNDRNKYDPEGKAGKARPGRPGIYLE